MKLDEKRSLGEDLICSNRSASRWVLVRVIPQYVKYFLFGGQKRGFLLYVFSIYILSIFKRMNVSPGAFSNKHEPVSLKWKTGILCQPHSGVVKRSSAFSQNYYVVLFTGSAPACLPVHGESKFKRLQKALVPDFLPFC